MMTTKLLSKNQKGIGIITLNRIEKCNAIDIDMRDALIQAFITFEKDPTVSVIILNANGKNFCAGADLNHMKAMSNASPEENLQDAKQFAALFYQIYACQKPVIACAHGKILGGGLGLLSSCDIVIATDDAQFCFSEVKVGLVPATIAPFVIQRIGYTHAKYYMLTAELFDAKKAREIKLVNQLCEKNQTPFDCAITLAESIRLNNPTAIQSTKKWLNHLNPITQTELAAAADVLAEARKAK